MIQLFQCDVNKKCLQLLPLFMIWSVFLFGNPDSLSEGIRVETKLNYGFIYPHHSAIEYLLARNIAGAEVTISLQSFGKNPWEEIYRYPRYGVGYNYTDFGNPDVLGCSNSLFLYYDIPFYRSNNNFSFNYQIDFGVSYLNKTYKPYINDMNLAISSHTNVYIGLDFNARWKIGKTNELKIALELSHVSNGKIKSPNLGLNAVSLSTAWIYGIKPDGPKLHPTSDIQFKRNFIELILNTGAKRDDMLNKQLYPISSFIADYNYATNLKYAFGAGTDLFFDGSLRKTKEYEEETSSAPSDNFQFGVHISARARYNNLRVLLDIGHYVIADFYKYSGVYSRLGFRYAINENLLFNMSIKAHYAIADYMEWGIGYRFKSLGL